jgi:acyl-homoserine-lactone acylase
MAKILQSKSLTTALALFLGLSATGSAFAQNSSNNDVEIRITKYGVPHIAARNLEGAGYGFGWALARDNLCLTTERFITIAGNRSAHLPADAKYMDAFAGGEISNFDSDAVYRYILSDAVVARLKTAASQDMKALVRGYANGFNAHIAQTPLAGETCRQSPWFRRITEDDVWRRIAHVPLLETSAGVLREIAAAAPPSATVTGMTVPNDTFTRLVEQTTIRGASNAIAFGRAGTEGGVGGLSFANPHYAWHGTERLYAFQLTVPGRINIFGATAYGLPFPMLGFSNKVGWGITHTTNKRSTVYELKLSPTDPTSYEIDGKFEPMKRVVVRVQTENGIREKTFYETRQGTLLEGQNIPWDNTKAYAWAEPELANVHFADQFLEIASAQNVRQIHASQVRNMGGPWSNITATDASGEVYYSNLSVAANITNAQLARCTVTGPIHRYMVEADLTTLDGSKSECFWTQDPRARRPGIVPAQISPYNFRNDVVFNSNDSHWYNNLAPNGRLEGFNTIIGPERTIRGERTRVAALYAKEIMEGGALTGSAGATPAKWEKLFFSSRNIHAEMILDDLIADCRANPSVTSQGITVELTEACDVLANWDRRDTLESRGSLLFEQFIDKLDAIPMTGFSLEEKYWRVPFDANDPVNTPRGFIATPETRLALGRTVYDFASLNVPLNSTLRDSQSVTRNGVTYPLSGGKFSYHMVRPMSYTPVKGVTEIRSGDSYIHNVALGPNGVTGRFIVTYSQSTNPSSPHFSDMLALYSAQTFADVSFSDAQIRAQQIGSSIFLNSGASSAQNRTATRAVSKRKRPR